MAKRRGRLDPTEVKLAMEAARPAAPAPPFNSPFAAARGQLEKLVPQSKKPRVVDRLLARAAKKTPEPSVLAVARAKHKAAREALAEAVKPIRRPGPARDSEGD